MATRHSHSSVTAASHDPAHRRGTPEGAPSGPAPGPAPGSEPGTVSPRPARRAWRFSHTVPARYTAASSAVAAMAQAAGAASGTRVPVQR
ncbi:Uncharacterised protein [Mycobacteroides abscessus subsp. abscessus]|nr:Uncharacterised protein [Mycobacteroides abscessus subsp. abscessus]